LTDDRHLIDGHSFAVSPKAVVCIGEQGVTMALAEGQSPAPIGPALFSADLTG